MGERVAALHDSRGHHLPHSQGVRPLVLSSAQSDQQAVMILVRPECWPDEGFFNICSEMRRERAISESQKNNSNGNKQLP